MTKMIFIITPHKLIEKVLYMLVMHTDLFILLGNLNAEAKSYFYMCRERTTSYTSNEHFSYSVEVKQLLANVQN